MSTFTEKAMEMRACTTTRYNCAQAVSTAFAEVANTDDETSIRIAAGFGGGMRRGSVCGAVTGGIMALGLLGLADKQTLEYYHQCFCNEHKDYLNCADLVRENELTGTPQKEFCDGLICECISLVERIAKEKGKL